MMTKRDEFIEKDVFMNMLMWLENWDGQIPIPTILKPRPLWTGKQIFNLFLPEGVNCRRNTSWHKDNEPKDMSPTDSQVGHLFSHSRRFTVSSQKPVFASASCGGIWLLMSCIF